MSTYIGAVSFEWARSPSEHPRSAHLGQMGDVIGLALGLARRPTSPQGGVPRRRRLGPDGARQLVVVGQEAPDNLVIVRGRQRVLRVDRLGERGGRRPTATARTPTWRRSRRPPASRTLPPSTRSASSNTSWTLAFGSGGAEDRCRFLNVKTAPGHARVTPRQSDGFEDKYRFVRYVEGLEGIQILGLARQDRQLMKHADAGRRDEGFREVAPFLTMTGITKALPGRHRQRRHRPRRRPRGDPWAARRERRREDDAHEHPLRPLSAG